MEGLKVSVQLLNLFYMSTLGLWHHWAGFLHGSKQKHPQTVNEFLKLSPEKKQKPDQSTINGSISFENVSYT
jgi:hypothetical protein